MSEAKFHSHIKQQAKLYFAMYFSIYIFGHKTERHIRYENNQQKRIYIYEYPTVHYKRGMILSISNRLVQLPLNFFVIAVLIS
jgi:hypothetical protein